MILFHQASRCMIMLVLVLTAVAMFMAGCVRLAQQASAPEPSRSKDVQAATGPAPTPTPKPSPTPRATPKPEPFDPAEYPPLEGVPADDGSIWPAVREWSLGWERAYAEWVSNNVDPDFFIRLDMAHDCADVPYMVRFIFARIHGLPQGCHDRHGNGWGSWSKSLAHLSRNADWRKDQRFRAALERVRWTVQCRSYPYDTHPIAVLPRHGWLRPGTVVTDDRHTRMISRVDRHSPSPIETSASTLPPAKRRLTVELFNLDTDFNVLEGYGIVNFNWWRRDPDGEGFHIVPDEAMPGYSWEQYHLLGQIKEAHLAIYLQKQYAYKIEDPEMAWREMMTDLHNAIDTRREVIAEGNAYYEANPWAVGREDTDAYEFFSTHARDRRIKTKYENLWELVDQDHMSEAELEKRLAAESLEYAPGRRINLFELGYAALEDQLSPEPWDPLDRRWGTGGYRLAWRRRLAATADHGLTEIPGVGVVAYAEMGTQNAFTYDGQPVWGKSRIAAQSPLPAPGPPGSLFEVNESGRLCLRLGNGSFFWTAESAGRKLIAIVYDTTSRQVIAATRNGEVKAWEGSTGAPAWQVDLDRILIGLGHDGRRNLSGAMPIVALSADGQLTALSDEGTVMWRRDLERRVESGPGCGPEGNVFVATRDGGVFAFDAHGKRLWTRSPGDYFIHQPVSDGQGNVVVAGKQTLYSYTPDGSRRWTAELGGQMYGGVAVTQAGRVYAGAIDHKLYALTPSGRIEWTFEAPGAIIGAPLARSFSETTLVYFGAMDHRLYALRERAK